MIRSKIFFILLLAVAMGSSPALAQRAAASFLEGFMRGKQQGEESQLPQAETERLKAETERLKAENDRAKGETWVPKSTSNTPTISKEEQWQNVISDFMDRAKAMDGIDYRVDKEKRAQFDVVVRYYGNKASEKGMTDEGLKASRWALEQAHSVMAARENK